MGILVGIGCRKRTGKDTLSDMLMNNIADYVSKENENLEYGEDGLPTNEVFIGYNQISLIQPAREFVDNVFSSLSREDKDSGEGLTYRQAVINIVDTTLKMDKDAFIKRVVEEVKSVGDDFVIIASDFRRLEEYEYLKKELGDNFVTVRVDKGDKVESYGEGSIDDDKYWDMIIDNNKDLEHLQTSSEKLWELIKGKIKHE